MQLLCHIDPIGSFAAFGQLSEFAASWARVKLHNRARESARFPGAQVRGRRTGLRKSLENERPEARSNIHFAVS